MNEIEEWFLNEFVDWGFSLSPMIFNPEDFSPCRMVLWEDQNGRTMNTGIKITPEDRKSTRLNSSHVRTSRMPSSA